MKDNKKSKKNTDVDPYYIASIPERFIRSTVSGITSVTSLVTKLVVPKSIKESSTYRVTIGMLQQFLIEEVANVEYGEKEIILKDNYIARKTAGSIIEGIGLISIKFSPVWMLAILSDVSSGSKTYLERLTTELKSNDLIDKNRSYDNVYELLEGVSKVTDTGVSVIDMPPITLDEFGQLKNELTEQLKSNHKTSKDLYHDLEKIYHKMNETSDKEKISMTKLNGAMTLDLMKKASSKGLDITKVTTTTSLKMINEEIVSSYKDSLDKLNRIGKRKYLIEHMTPFMIQVKEHYKREHETLTERALHRILRNKRDK